MGRREHVAVRMCEERQDTFDEEALWILSRMRRRIDCFGVTTATRLIEYDAEKTQFFYNQPLHGVLSQLAHVHSSSHVLPELKQLFGDIRSVARSGGSTEHTCSTS